MNNKTVKKGLFPYVFLFIFIIGCLLVFNVFNAVNHELSYTEFKEYLNDKDVTELNITLKTRTSTYEITGKLKEYKENETFSIYVPYSDEFITEIMESKNSDKIKINTYNDPETSSFLLIISNYLPIIILVGATFWLFTRQIGGNNKSMDFGKE